MIFIDSHCHIYSDVFEKDRSELIESAQRAGISKLIMPAIDLESHTRMLEMETAYPGTCISMMGLHPCSVKGDAETELSAVRSYLDQRKFVAVGEIGLDFYWDKSYRNQQYDVFRKQISWALDLDLPIVIHSRDALDECIEVVEEFKGSGLKGIFHCFGGSLDQAERIIANGFMLGIGGVLTFRNSGLDKVVEKVPLHHIVLETDAPYLTPAPHRGKRNLPEYLVLVAEKLAEITGETIAKVAEITRTNTEKVFRL